MFIKLTTVNATNSSLDTEIHLKSEQILGIQKPTRLDHQTRAEIKSLVLMENGTCYAVLESPEEILEQLV